MSFAPSVVVVQNIPRATPPYNGPTFRRAVEGSVHTCWSPPSGQEVARNAHQTGPTRPHQSQPLAPEEARATAASVRQASGPEFRLRLVQTTGAVVERRVGESTALGGDEGPGGEAAPGKKADRGGLVCKNRYFVGRLS